MEVLQQGQGWRRRERSAQQDFNQAAQQQAGLQVSPAPIFRCSLTRASCRSPAAAAACCCRPPQLLAAAAAAAPPRRLSCARAAGAAADVLVALARLNAARHRACRLRPAAAMLPFAANPNFAGLCLLRMRPVDRPWDDAGREARANAAPKWGGSGGGLGRRERPVGALSSTALQESAGRSPCPVGRCSPLTFQLSTRKNCSEQLHALQALTDH